MECCLRCWLEQQGTGALPFSMGGAVCLAKLRKYLRELRVNRFSKFGLHAFRRGHAQDMLSNGATLTMILRAGEWRSAAFMSYLNMADLGERAVLEAHYAMSEAEGEAET